MRVWTIQPQSLYEKLQNETFLHCAPSKSEPLMDWGFQPAYDWLVEQMIKRVGLPPRCRRGSVRDSEIHDVHTLFAVSFQNETANEFYSSQ